MCPGRVMTGVMITGTSAAQSSSRASVTGILIMLRLSTSNWSSGPRHRREVGAWNPKGVSEARILRHQWPWTGSQRLHSTPPASSSLMAYWFIFHLLWILRILNTPELVGILISQLMGYIIIYSTLKFLLWTLRHGLFPKSEILTEAGRDGNFLLVSKANEAIKSIFHSLLKT